MEKKNQKNSEMKIEEVNFENIGKDKEFEKVTFDFLSPDHKYLINLKLLMRKTFQFVTWDFDQVLWEICEQNEFGIFLSIFDEDTEESLDPSDNLLYACTTILNLQKLKKDQFFFNLINFLNPQLDENQKEFFKLNFLDESKTNGILINERVVNLPAMVVPQIYQQLLEDKFFIETDQDYPPEEKQTYNYEYLIYFTVGVLKDNKKEGLIQINDLNFSKVEDRAIMKSSIFKVVFDQIKNLSGDLRLVLAVLKYEDLVDLVTDKKTFE